ncbi:MAG: hypothetical protein C4530_06480 [Desulfobacteraceae bacterium]|nr:MAG: hypothetical protein C4530_06480 [Desulfobacteraceae bacterium]
MAGLQFRFAELVREIKALKAISRDFIDSSTSGVLDEFESNLNFLWSASGTKHYSLQLRPLKTKLSEGAYDRGRGANIYAAITGKWDVRPVGYNPRKHQARQKRLLEFCGTASTKIELFDASCPEQRIAMWRIEVGTEDSPGCYFHIQILGDKEDPPFPKAIPIPRLPSIFITPMCAIEYVLGELFQDQWAKAVARDSGDLPYWRDLQRKRLLLLFDWYRQVLNQAISSAWMALKTAKPEPAIFVSD